MTRSNSDSTISSMPSLATIGSMLSVATYGSAATIGDTNSQRSVASAASATSVGSSVMPSLASIRTYDVDINVDDVDDDCDETTVASEVTATTTTTTTTTTNGLIPPPTTITSTRTTASADYNDKPCASSSSLEKDDPTGYNTTTSEIRIRHFVNNYQPIDKGLVSTSGDVRPEHQLLATAIETTTEMAGSCLVRTLLSYKTCRMILYFLC